MYIKDLTSGKVREYGTNQHDALTISDDGRCLYYEHLQCCEGSRFGSYRFCDKDGLVPEEDEVLMCHGAEAYFNIGGWDRDEYGRLKTVKKPEATDKTSDAGKPAEVVDFEKYQGKTNTTAPTWEEVQCLKILTSRYGHDEMVDVACWDGSCWETIFKTMKEHALSIGCDPWDTFAVFITKLMGTTFEETDEGWVVTRGGNK